MKEGGLRGGAGTNYRGPGVRKGDRGPTGLNYVFVFLGSSIICLLYKLAISDQSLFILQLTLSFLFFFFWHINENHT